MEREEEVFRQFQKASLSQEGEKSVFSRRERRGGLKGQVLIEKIYELYPQSDQAVFYRSDHNLHQFISPETLNNIFTVAQEGGVIPLPYRAGGARGRVGWFYPRNEIIAAIAYREKLRQEGKSLLKTAKRLRRESKESQRLTLKEVAEKLDLKVGEFRKLLAKGEIDLGNVNLTESIRRIKNPGQNKHKFIDQTILEKEEVKEAVQRWKNRYENLEALTRSIFRRERHLFATVFEIATCANLHSSLREVKQLAQILVEGRVKVVRLSGYKNLSYWVLSENDKEKAIEILRGSPKVDKWRKSQVQQIAGPKIDRLPTIWQLRVRKRHNFVSVASFLRSVGIKIGGRSKIRVSNFFDTDSPVSIIKYRRNYYSPADQKDQLLEYLQKK